MLAQRRREVVERTAKELGAEAWTCDVASRQEVEKLVQDTINHFGQGLQ